MKQTGWLFVFWYAVSKWRDWYKAFRRTRSRHRAAATRRKRAQRIWEMEVLEREYQIAKGLAKRPIGRIREELGIAKTLATKPIKALERELSIARGLVRGPKPKNARRNTWV